MFVLVLDLYLTISLIVSHRSFVLFCFTNLNFRIAFTLCLFFCG